MERSETVAGCTPWLSADGQYGGYDMPIVTGNRVFVRKITTPIPDPCVTVPDQKGTLAQSSSGYATGATSSTAGAQATSQVPPQIPDITGADLSSISPVMDVIPGKVHSSRSDPDSKQVSPLPSGVSLTEDADLPQQPTPPEYELLQEEAETENVTVTTENITVPVTHQEETPPPFDGPAPTPFSYMYTHEKDPFRSFRLVIANGWETQPTLNQLPVPFTMLSSQPPTPTSSKSRFFDNEVSMDSGFTSMTSTNH